MDEVNQFQELFNFDRWANQETFASVIALDAPHAERPLKLLAHVLGASELWLARFESPQPSLPPWPAMTREAVESAIENLHAGWTKLLSQIGSEGLDRDLVYRNTQGGEFKTPIRDVVTHLLMHSAYHRGQVAAAVREAGGKPAATDYVVWVRRGRPR